MGGNGLLLCGKGPWRFQAKSSSFKQWAEFDKGDDLHKEVYQLLQDSSLNFTGNIEGHELLQGKADVVVTDGFTGNAVLKSIEGTGQRHHPHAERRPFEQWC